MVYPQAQILTMLMKNIHFAMRRLRNRKDSSRGDALRVSIEVPAAGVPDFPVGDGFLIRTLVLAGGLCICRGCQTLD